MDAWWIEFVGENWLTMTLFLMFAKGVAEMTPGEWDNKIADLFSGMLNFVRTKEKKDE